MTREETGQAVRELVQKLADDGVPDEFVTDALLGYAVQVADGLIGPDKTCQHLFLFAANRRRQLDEAAADAMLEKALSGSPH